MKIRHWILVSLTLAVTGLMGVEVDASAPDRYYKMGDEAGEGAGNGNPVGVTWDSQGDFGVSQLVDLTAINGPTYTNVIGRPDGVGGLGIQFNLNSAQYLTGAELGNPSTTITSLNYSTLTNRGLEFWVKPASTTAQSLVMDTNQHGVRINASGNFSMRYNGVDYDSIVPASTSNWHHVMVVRPNGAANGSRMYVNGIAVAAAPGDYNLTDTTDLYVGTNTTTTEFFSGIIDDLKMFVIGQAPATTTPPLPAANYGAFNLAVDNDFIASPITGISGDLGDLDGDGEITPADKSSFISGWMDKKIVNGFQIGDLATYEQGDLNFDGITNIHDLLIMQTALANSGVGAITGADLAGSIPEPSTMALLLFAAIGLAVVKRLK